MKRSFQFIQIVLLGGPICLFLFALYLRADPVPSGKQPPPITPTTPEVTELEDVGDGSTGDSFYIRGRQSALEGKYDEAATMLEKALKSDPENAYLLHQLAEVYLKLGKDEKSEGFAQRAVEKEPGNMEYRTTLGNVLTSLKRYEEAKQQYSKILEEDSNNERILLLLGILEVESGQVQKGLSTLTQAIVKNPDSAMAYFYRAKVYVDADELGKARADLEKCMQLRPNFIEAGMALGLLHERRGEIDEAIATYQKIQGNGRFRKRLAQLYLQKNELQKALSELLEYEKTEPEDYTAKVKIGLIYFELKQYKVAIKHFNDILLKEPNADNVRFYLGAVYEENKELDKAIVEFEKVTKDNSFYKEAKLHIGFILKEQGKYKKGIELGKRLNKESPDVPEFFDLHASFYEVEKNFKQAITVIELGLKRHPNDERLLYFQGALLDKIGERTKAMELMRQILKVNPNNAHALNFLGYSFAELGQNLDEAESLILKAIELRPNDGYIQDSLGWVYFKKANLDLAEKHLEKAMAAQPEEPIIIEHLGDVHLERKNYKKAVELYKKAATICATKKDKEMAKKLEAKLATIEKEKRLPSTAP